MTTPLILWLDDVPDIAGDPVAVAGGKAANLGRLLRAGLSVPPGFVITTIAYRAFISSAAGLMIADDVSEERVREYLLHAPFPADLGAAILAAYERFGAPAVAVRSSGTAEDLATASFAGQHDTVLDVRGPDALLAAVRTCWASLWSSRAIVYRRERYAAERDSEDDPPEPDSRSDPVKPGAVALAVVVQRMIPADVAGVAFTANPITGDRSETTISAVRGLGERLVSGQADAEEWVVRGRGDEATATCHRAANGILNAAQALTIADVARRIETHFGTPQDIEWAISGGEVFVLQARPMTALPEPVEWKSPLPGGWMRDFRLGEWLSEPVTPLFESWLLTHLEAGFAQAAAQDVCVRFRSPYHVIVNGWYFSSPVGSGVRPGSVALALLRHPLRVLAVPLSLSRPRFTDWALAAPLERRWRDEVLPRYQRLVASWQERVGTASPAGLVRLVDEIAAIAGAYFWLFSVVGGHAWKVERALAKFYRASVVPRQPSRQSSHQDLLVGLLPPFPKPPPHAVQSLDWYRPTLGEMERVDAGMMPDDLATGQRSMEEKRRAAEAACREALASQPKLLKRFDDLLALAQRYAITREAQARWFTLGWPVMRRAILRLGDLLYQRGAIEQVDDIFFLTRAELDLALSDHTRNPRGLRSTVAGRRGEWERQRRLSPPLALGKPFAGRLVAGTVEILRVPPPVDADMPGSEHLGEREVLRGMPASPGRATGTVRIVLGPEDFGRVRPGDVLVAQVTAPAWTPLFRRIAAVVTDGGSIAAHASLVAREYGIPAVVGTGDATARLRDGQVITVDGSAGVVELAARVPV